MTEAPKNDAESLNPYEQQLSDTPVETKAHRRARRPKPLVPPLWVWIVVAFAAAMIILVRVRYVSGDHAVVNILTLLLGFLGCCAVSLWYLFFSGYSIMFRLGSLIGLVTCVTLFFTAFRVEHVSGEMVPTFRARWTPPADALLDTPAELGAVEGIELTATEQDFPQFLGPHRNGTIPDVHLARDWKNNPLQLLWRQPIGAGWSSFAAVNGYAVTMEQRGAEELVTCYQIATGKLLWAHSEANRHSTVMGGVGPRSTPTIHEGKVYTLGPSGSLLCLEGATGEVVWHENLLSRYNVSPEDDGKRIAWGRSHSPLIVDDLIVVPACGPEAGPPVSLAAFNRLTGELVWEAGDRQVSYASAALAMFDDQQVIVSVNENNVTGHAPATGEILWQVEWDGNSSGSANTSQANLMNDGHLLLSKGYGVGGALWQLAYEGDEKIGATEIWADNSVMKTKFTNLVIDQGFAYGLSDGILECIEIESGKRQWKKGRYGHGQILLVGDVLLVQAESGEVAMVELSSDRFNEIGKFDAIDGKTWNNLCLYGDLLLVRNAEEAACYRLPLADHTPARAD